MKAWKRNILAFEGGSNRRLVEERRAFNKQLKVGRTKGWRENNMGFMTCLLYTSPSPRDVEESRMP